MSIRFPLKTEIALAADLTADPSTWVWTDISTYCYVRSGGFTSRRGRGDWQSQSPPTSFTLLLNNRDGRFSRLNPTGPYYGQLRKNTPVRVSANPGSGYVVRATGYVSEWPVEWDLSETDFIVDSRADGVLRRLQQGQSPAKSALRRTITAVNAAAVPIAYWPLEGSAASGLPQGEPMSTAGVVEFSASVIPEGSLSACDLSGGGQLTAPVPVTPETSWQLEACLGFASLATSVDYPQLEVRTPGTYNRWGIETFTSSGENHWSMFWHDGVTLFSLVGTSNLRDGVVHHVRITAEQSGSNISVALFVDGVQETSQTFAGILTMPTKVIANPLNATGLDIVDSISHIVLWAPTATSVDVASAAAGYANELSGDRVTRLCAEEGIAADVTTGATEAMGPQPPATVLEMLRECEAAEEGLIIERRTGELGFDPVSARYNIDPTLELDYAQRHVQPPFRPTDDDRFTRNDVTITRAGGSSAQIIDQTGPMGVDTVGRYDESLTLNLADDDQSVHHAGWRVNLGTVDEYRYPSVNLKLHSPVLASLLDDIVSVDIGSRITIANLPDNLPPDLVDLVVEGINERIDNFTWDIELVCSPYRPYQVGEFADATGDTNEWLGRYAGDDDAALRVAVDSDDLTFLIDPNRTRFITSAVDADSFDPDIEFRLGGELVAVSAITTTAGTFVAAGAMSSADNAAVTPALFAGNTALDLILVVGRIRSASAGTIAMPADYTRLPITGFNASSPLQVWAKVHDGSESNPTVTPTGGAAGDTVSAVTLGYRGMPCTLEDLTDIVVASLGQSNASAQNIAYPGLFTPNQAGCVFLAIGGKDDDWTSVAALSGLTEALDSSTTTGSDQGLVVDYQIQTTPAVVNEGSFVVTGGASAVSEGAVLALAAGFQTFTVSARNVNGIAGGKSHAAGTKIEVVSLVAAL